jgi:queuosine biosynthesis protein QueC
MLCSGAVMTIKKALVVLSGGQDSTTCLYWAIDRFGVDNVSSVTFDYGQRHRIELSSASEIADFAKVSNVILPIDTFAALGGDALTDSAITVARELNEDTGLPNTFVPGRNRITQQEADDWAMDLRDLGEAGEYFFSVNRYLFQVIKPGLPSEG